MSFRAKFRNSLNYGMVVSSMEEKNKKEEEENKRKKKGRDGGLQAVPNMFS